MNMFENRTQSVGVPLKDVIFNFGSFAVVERAFLSSSNFLWVISNSALSFSSHIRRSCSSCLIRSSAARRSSSCCCSCFDSNRHCSISSSISSCLFLRVFDSLSLSAIKVAYLDLMSFFHCLTDGEEVLPSIFNSSKKN